MKILFIHNRYRESYGGEDAALEAEMKLLIAKGQEVRLLAFDNAHLEEGALAKIGAGIKAAYNPSAARQLRKEIQAFQPDIIHVHNFFFTASPSVIMEACRQRVPVIVTLHNFRLICVNALLTRDNKICELCVNQVVPWWGIRYKCYHNSVAESAMVAYMSALHKLLGTWRNKVDMFITPGAFSGQKLLHSSLKIPKEKMTVKRNFVEDYGMAAARERSSFYLFAGRLSQEKGIDFLVQTFSRLPGEELVIAGDGPEQKYLLENFGHLPNIKFVGKQDKAGVISLMKSCRALLFPSTCYEGAPLSIIEAFSTGTPVIASRLGGMAEMIADHSNGLLFDAGSEEQLKAALAEMNQYCAKDNYSLYQNARDSYMSTYHPDQCYASVMTIYKNVLQQKQPTNGHA